MKLINHLRVWNEWRKHNLNSGMYKFLVLIGFIHSPTYNVVANERKFDWENFYK